MIPKLVYSSQKFLKVSKKYEKYKAKKLCQ